MVKQSVKALGKSSCKDWSGGEGMRNLIRRLRLNHNSQSIPFEGKTRKEMILTYFKVQSRYFNKRTKVNQEIPQF